MLVIIPVKEDIKPPEKKISNLTNSFGVQEFFIKIPSNILVPNSYTLTFGFHIPNLLVIDYLKDCLSFQIVETGSEFQSGERD